MTKVFWFYGRSGAGKSTLAQRLHKDMLDRKISVVCLDGDNLRSTLCSDLGFNPEARLENHRRIAEMAGLLLKQDLNVIISTIAPEYQQRDLVSRILGNHLVWFYIHAPLEICMQRDPKGIYKRALEGQIQDLINYPFDAPRPQEDRNRIDTIVWNIDECYMAIRNKVNKHLASFVI